MKKYTVSIICVFVLCFSGLAFGEGRGHGRGDSGHSRGYDDNRHGNHDNGYHNNHNPWDYRYWAAVGPVVITNYPPVYYTPVQRCQYVDLFDAWGNYMGRERVCN
ncbi:MAG: hypothetical protein WCQ99_14650 [Pseudomonadota bacterium]